MLLSRERFANSLRIYSRPGRPIRVRGQVLRVLSGSRVPIRTSAGAEAFRKQSVTNPEVVTWDLHELDERDGYWANGWTHQTAVYGGRG